MQVRVDLADIPRVVSLIQNDWEIENGANRRTAAQFFKMLEVCMYVCTYMCVCICIIIMRLKMARTGALPHSFSRCLRYVCMYVHVYVCVLTHLETAVSM